MNTQSFLQELAALPGYQGQMVFRREESPPPQGLERALAGLGLLPLYSQQMGP